MLIAGVIAWYFGTRAWKQPRPGLIAATIAWLLYAVHEYLIVAEVTCEAKCNIRVDLLLLWPVLLIVTLLGVYPPGQWTLAGKVFRGIGVSLLTLVLALFVGMYVFET